MDRGELNAKRAAATATSGGVGVVELESGAMQAIDIIHFGSVHVEQAGFVDEDLQAFKLEYGIALVVESFIEAHTIRETGAAAANNLDAKSGVGFGLIRQDLPDLFFRLFCQCNRHNCPPLLDH